MCLELIPRGFLFWSHRGIPIALELFTWRSTNFGAGRIKWVHSPIVQLLEVVVGRPKTQQLIEIYDSTKPKCNLFIQGDPRPNNWSMKSEIAFQRSGDPFTRIILFLILSVWRRFWDDDQLLIILLFECNNCNIIALTFDYLFPVCFLSHSVLMLPNGSRSVCWFPRQMKNINIITPHKSAGLCIYVLLH